MDIISNYSVLKDGYAGVRPVTSYSQAELAHMVETAESEWTARKSSLTRLMKQETYSQNLAKRIFELPTCLPAKLGALLDCRFVATNKNPRVRREWKIVMLEQTDAVMTDEGQRGHRRGLWSRGESRQGEPVRKWLAILRGRDTKVSEESFATFTTSSNPWCRVDERQAAEQYERDAGQESRV
ncbi:hypothetical protein F5B18DRAFT_612049 [Nemania serpens]|nr:hypothetical protein F5B18DRAFT_612049 [Nemania serpens]